MENTEIRNNENTERNLEQGSDSNSQSSSSSFTKYQWILVIILGVVNVCASMVYSIQAPFYPKEAESKNCTGTEYGLVFGSYELTTFIICPIIGTCMHRIGSRISFHFGLIITGTSVILFGLLPLLEEHDTFLAASFALRITEAIGSSIVFIATTTLVTANFPNSIATVFATLELTFGLGFSVGPTVGAALYQINGFSTPFTVLGGTILALSIVTFFILCVASKGLKKEHNNNNQGSTSPASDNLQETQIESASPPSYAFLDLLKIQSLNIYSITNTAGALAVGFLTATLEPHIRKYKLSTVMTGFMFFLYGGVYACVAPLVGKMCDKIERPVFVTLLGSSLIFTAFLLLGPAPFLPLKSLLPITIVGLIIFGLGLAGVYVSSFLLTLQEAKKHGFPDHPSTSAIVSALWMSCISFGCFVGPSVGGALMDNFGFRHATLFVLVLEGIVIILLLIHIFRNMTSAKQKLVTDESTTLLPNET